MNVGPGLATLGALLAVLCPVVLHIPYLATLGALAAVPEMKSKQAFDSHEGNPQPCISPSNAIELGAIAPSTATAVV